MRLGDDPTWYELEDAMETGAQIVSALLELPYQYGEPFGGVAQQLIEAKLSDLVGKSLAIEVAIDRLGGGKIYSGTYTVVFEEVAE